jgi:NAD(P)-dependent dehydrogenase (short-subunit alcohol dehydrogenase family)
MTDHTTAFTDRRAFTGRTALIVGGTSGIGLATARRLLGLGAAVHVAGRSKERVSAVTLSDPGLHVHQADGSSAGQISALAGTLGRIDWLIVTLSGSEGPGPLADLDLAMLRRAFDAKFWGHITTVQAALPRLAPDGSITLLGAITARAAMPGTAGIASINGAVEALVKPLAAELAPIRVNGVSPGFVDTPWWNGMPDDDREAYFAHAAAQLPARRIATADDVADAVVLAATNDNLTGTIIETDGGARLVSLG